jgi:hypothetical protein
MNNEVQVNNSQKQIAEKKPNWKPPAKFNM